MCASTDLWEPWAGNRPGPPGRAMPLPTEASNEAEEVRRRYGGMAVGPVHSRGVVGVMPGAGSGPTRRGWQ
jgi:hypothetical protein